jgi:hypothetical protein
MTSNLLNVAGMKTESEYPDVFLDFIKQHGILSALQIDDTKSEMSWRVQHIHMNLSIAG